jgi:hypothetical protein
VAQLARRGQAEEGGRVGRGARGGPYSQWPFSGFWLIQGSPRVPAATILFIANARYEPIPTASSSIEFASDRVPSDTCGRPGASCGGGGGEWRGGVNKVKNTGRGQPRCQVSCQQGRGRAGQLGPWAQSDTPRHTHTHPHTHIHPLTHPYTPIHPYTPVHTPPLTPSHTRAAPTCVKNISTAAALTNVSEIPSSE